MKRERPAVASSNVIVDERMIARGHEAAQRRTHRELHKMYVAAGLAEGEMFLYEGVLSFRLTGAGVAARKAGTAPTLPIPDDDQPPPRAA
jgi:hypothetical protein